MARVKIEDLKSEARNLDRKEMKKLFGGAIYSGSLIIRAEDPTDPSRFMSGNIVSIPDDDIPALTTNLVKM
jgi:hypothetical protein